MGKRFFFYEMNASISKSFNPLCTVRLLLRHGADPDDDEHGKLTHFMHAVHWVELEKVHEMAKWKAKVGEVKKEDILKEKSYQYDHIMKAIQDGQEERKKYIGEREKGKESCELL